MAVEEAGSRGREQTFCHQVRIISSNPQPTLRGLPVGANGWMVPVQGVGIPWPFGASRLAFQTMRLIP